MDLNAFQEYFNKHDQFSVRNGIRLTRIQEGYAEAEMDFAPETCNLMGTMHGGAYYTLADVAAGSAIIPYGKICVTLGADMHYLRPASGGKITAYATVRQHGGRIGVCNVEIRDQAGELLCMGTITMYITSKQIPEDLRENERRHP
jgi:acyl-CoA thioesterase